MIAPGAGGVAIVSSNCTPIVRGVSYAFAEKSNLDVFALEVGGDTSSKNRALGLCWVIAQETAHSMGLDHEFRYSDDQASSCNDPMTYRDDCGGQKFFRNRFAVCGEFPNDGVSPRDCKCGINQNSHLKLLSVFGEGTSTIPAPTALITTPGQSSMNANSLPTTIIASAGSKRGVNRVELFVNGHEWAEVKGAPFARNIGQPIPSSYSIQIPASLPNSIVDIQIKAFDDLEVVGESPTLTLVKGAAGGCADATTCAEGQRCEAGKCFWDPPAGEVGDPCTFPEFCKSGQCSDSVIQADGICTQPCVVGVADGCPTGLECIAVGNGGVCYTAGDGSGCCSTSRDTPWAPLMLGAGILGFVVLRRRRKS